MLDHGPSLPDAAADLARRCFDADVTIAAGDPRVPAPLMAGEGAAVHRAIAKRQIEFAAGRGAARGAMAQMGLPLMAVPAGPDRAPVWPAGLTGSLSHCEQVCLAVLGRKPGILALGVDIEAATPLAVDLWPVVCTPPEIAWLDQQADPGVMAKLLFCIKEAAYKAQYPVTGLLFGFERLIAEPDCKTGCFQVSFTENTGGFDKGASLSGKFVIENGLIVAGLTLRP